MEAERSLRLFRALQSLLAIEPIALGPVLNEASQVVAVALGAEKVDIFLYEAHARALVAAGMTNSPMGREQARIGLNRLAIADGGLAVRVFKSGRSIATGRADQEEGELEGIIKLLGVRSELVVPLEFAGSRRGVIQAFSDRPDFFRPEVDLQFLESVAHWVGSVAHRAELTERLALAAFETGHREAAEAMIDLLTPRQQEIAKLIASGLTNEEIGNQLFLASGSVANHIERILLRLGATRRTQIAAWIATVQAHLPERPTGDPGP